MIKNIVIGVLALLTLLLGYARLADNGFLGANPTGQQHRQLESFLLGLSVGPDRVGTNYKAIISGTCYLKADGAIAATSTGMADCVSSSFVAGDKVIIGGLATSTTELAKQITIQGTGIASTTNGYAPVRILNWSGATLTPSSKNGLGSSTPFTILRPW